MKCKAAFKSPKLENIAAIRSLTDYFQAGLIRRHSVLSWVGDVQMYPARSLYAADIRVLVVV
jgi:hypothetical protein